MRAGFSMSASNPENAERLNRLRRWLDGRSMYVSALPNIRYLTGFTGSAGHLLVTPREAVLYTDGRYRAQAAQQVSGIDVNISLVDSRLALIEGIRRLGIRRLVFETDKLHYSAYAYLAAELPSCRVTPTESQVERLRMCKSPSEIEAIRRSIEVNSLAFDEVCQRIEGDWTEIRLAAELELSMRKLGAEGASFPTIVASAEHGALPHAEPRAVEIRRNALVVVDQGAIVNGYCSDMTRMISLGHPNAAQIKLFEAVLDAQAAAIDAIRPGVECRAVDSKARQVLKQTTIDSTRLDKAFTHSTGHGLGLEIHEGPSIGPRRRRKLRPGMVITVEPGAYLEGFAGTRIEDVVVVTEDGCEVLTQTSRALRVLEV